MEHYRPLAVLLRENESTLMEIVLSYAIKYGYTKYTSTLVEAWRLSVSGLTRSIIEYIKANPQDIPAFRAESEYRSDALATFAVVEAQRHRSRGIDLGLFLGLFKYYRDAYIDIINGKVDDAFLADQYKKYIVCCFDRFELAFCIEWATASEGDKISELQRKNILLTNEKNKYLTLFESITSPILLLNARNEIDNINHAGIGLLERQEETGFFYYNDEDSIPLLDSNSTATFKYKGKSVIEIFPWMNGPLQTFDRFHAKCNQFTTAVFHESVQKDEIYCVTIFAMRDLSKKFSGKIVFFENITDKVTAEKHLLESEKKYRMLVETMNEGILVLNERCCVSFINDKLSDLLGIAKEEIVGRGFEDFLHPESKENFLKQQMLRKDGCAESYEVALLNCAGEKVFVLSSPTPLFSENGVYNGSYEIITNISNIKLIEMQLIQSQKMETIGVLAAGLAHEINTPLQYVIGNSSFLKDALSNLADYISKTRELLKSATIANLQEALERVDCMFVDHDIEFNVEEAPSALKSCLEGLDRIASIVSSVKQFAHPDTNELISLDVNREISNAVKVSTNEWKYTSEVHTEFDENLPLLPCVASEFNQAVLNIILNAAHAIQDRHDGVSSKGLIIIRTKYDKHNILISIQDNGTGIPAAIQNKIFNPFFTTKVVGKGTGMGLAIVLKIIEKHKGKIWFESREGEGTTFFVQIPILDLPGMTG